MPSDDVFHEGEIAMQARAGERAAARGNSAMITGRVPARARPFLETQRLVVVAAADRADRPFASLWSGLPGFLASAEDGGRVRIALAPETPAPEDPLADALSPGRRAGLLAIDLRTRRRLRVNGTILTREPGALTLAVEEAFPNCPKYIQKRDLSMAPAFEGGAETVERGEALDHRRRALVARVDTAFVATSHPSRGFDASHRGGEPGFIRVEDERALRIPDYAGNGLFQTLGNLAVDPRAGLTLIDFERGLSLALTGTATVHFDADEASLPTGGTARAWRFRVEGWIQRPLPSGLRFALLERSPHNPAAPEGAMPAGACELSP